MVETRLTMRSGFLYYRATWFSSLVDKSTEVTVGGGILLELLRALSGTWLDKYSTT